MIEKDHFNLQVGAETAHKVNKNALIRKKKRKVSVTCSHNGGLKSVSSLVRYIGIVWMDTKSC